MRRGYRRFTIAACGCLILVKAAEGKHKHGQQGQHSYEQQRGTPAPATVKPPVSPKFYQPNQDQCVSADGKQELCSRASAQAAVDQARYARWQAITGGLGVAIGIGTLVAAFLAAKWAKAAATHTASGAREAAASARAAQDQVEVAKEALRPHVVATQISGSLGSVGVIKVSFANSGNSTARNIKANLQCRIYAIHSDDSRTVSTNSWDYGRSISPLPSASTIIHEFSFHYGTGSREVNDLVAGNIEWRLFHALVRIEINYDWPFGRGESIFFSVIDSWNREIEPSGIKAKLKGRSGLIRESEEEQAIANPPA